MVAPLSNRPILGRAVRPILAFVAVTVVGVVGYVLLAGIGPVEATFWLVDLTSVEFTKHYEPTSTGTDP
jgi:voltage-gated potassium channel